MSKLNSPLSTGGGIRHHLSPMYNTVLSTVPRRTHTHLHHSSDPDDTNKPPAVEVEELAVAVILITTGDTTEDMTDMKNMIIATGGAHLHHTIVVTDQDQDLVPTVQGVIEEEKPVTEQIPFVPILVFLTVTLITN
ncbi:PREDICTED: uncharacterized protein LOC106547043 isoform X1 [Thamnophis sirtalis]|uniref:Uncharacterized protein LOC106547043 isoform X1 n=1 Tax=Thamnophis sirtalis TaxID=35019 RepID=A0A6I9Y9Z8_9SAUR|nr:PREDICTED: uncharacterized protein LOC106547043 isoform X1 [Thamnophis sirtalis]